MPDYMASHRTKRYFNIHSRDIIISHNCNHYPVLPVMFLCLCRPLLGLPCRVLYSGSLFVVPCLGFLCLDLDLADGRAPVQACCVSWPLRTWRSQVLLFHGVVCGCSSSVFSHWLPLLPVFAGWFRWHFERHWPFPGPGSSMSIIIFAVRLTCWVDDASSAAQFWYSPLVGVLCAAMFAYVDVKSLNVWTFLLGSSQHTELEPT